VVSTVSTPELEDDDVVVVVLVTPPELEVANVVTTTSELGVVDEVLVTPSELEIVDVVLLTTPPPQVPSGSSIGKILRTFDVSGGATNGNRNPIVHILPATE